MNKRMMVSEMKPGQLFAFSRQSMNDSIIWQRKGTRTISRVNKDTGEVLNTFYFLKEDYGYCIDQILTSISTETNKESEK